MVLMFIRWLLTLCCFAAVLQAQADANRGSIAGLVLDGSGAPVPGARVLAIQLDSGLEREAVTQTDGAFRLISLLPGSYELRFENGSVGAIVRDVAVHVGSAVQVSVKLALQNAPDSVAINTSALSVADADMTQVIPLRAIRELPINGRRFQEFATLTPGTMAAGETLGQISFVGQRGVHSNVLVDGTDYNEPFVGGIRGGDRSTAAFTIPQSAIQEFQAVLSGYSAEYGRSTGGVLNAITRAGTNTYHGEGLYLVRDGALSTASPLGQQTLERQHLLGGSVGGPIFADRLFFLGAAEQQLSRLPREVRFSALDGVNRTAEIAPAYDLFRSLEGPFRQTNDATAVFGRLDYLSGRGNALAVRYQYSRNNAENAAALGSSLNSITNSALSGNGREWDTVRGVGGQLTSVLRSWLLNDLRVQYSYEQRRRVPNSRTPLIDAGVLGSIGTPALLPANANDRRLQFADSVSILKGSHSLKLGVDYSYINFYQWYGDNQFGAFTITNPSVEQTLRILSASGGASGNRFDDPSVIYRRQVGSLATSSDAHQLAFFAQDTWRVLPTLNLNLGLRWEGQINPGPQTGNDFLVRNVRDFPFPLGKVDPTFLPNQMNQWAPRLGIAWSPGRGATVLRAHAGLFYAQTPFILYTGALNSFSDSPADLSLEIAPGASGSVYQQFLKGGFDLNRIDLAKPPVYSVPQVWMNVAGQPNQFAQSNVVTTSGKDFRNPRSAQLAFGVQHRVSSRLLLDYQLNSVNTVHLTRNIDYNIPVPFVRPADLSQLPFFGLRSGVSRPNPNVGQVLVRRSDARSRYTGNSFRFQWSGGRFDMAAHYTLAFNKSDDDSERAISGITYQNPFDLRREYNWSALDSRHTASGYVLFRGPWGIDLTSLFRYQSGLPLDASTGSDSSGLLTGARGNRPLVRPGESMFRNSFRNLDYKNVDLRILKGFSVTESVRLQFSAELFNLLNFDNVRFLPSSVLANNPALNYGPGIAANGQVAPINPGFLNLRLASGAYDPAATGQQGTPLQAQLGIRLIF